MAATVHQVEGRRAWLVPLARLIGAGTIVGIGAVAGVPAAVLPLGEAPRQGPAVGAIWIAAGIALVTRRVPP